jgi:glycosyltransferase involved in cell wall biosynthesis
MNKSLKSHPHILFLPSFYSDPDKPVVGSFFKEQALAVASIGIKVGLAYYEPRSIRKFGISSLKENHFQITSSQESELTVLRLHGFNPYLQSTLGGLVWSLFTEYLVNRYIAIHGRPDLIHAHNALWAGYAANRINRRLGIPYVLTEHSGAFLTGEVSSIQKRFASRVYSGASEVITVSVALATSLEGMLKPRNPRIIPNCVDSDFFTLPPSPRHHENFSFLAIAHLSDNKGIDILIKSFAKKFANRTDTRLTIGGEGPIRNDLVALACKLGVEERVTFLGALSRGAVRDAMWNADALVVSSFHETFGIVLIEAFATGIPVIATRCGGPNDIVIGEIGIQVKPGDVEDLADALEKMRSGPLYSSETLRKHAQKKYDRPVFAKLLKEVYNGCLATTRHT